MYFSILHFYVDYRDVLVKKVFTQSREMSNPNSMLYFYANGASISFTIFPTALPPATHLFLAHAEAVAALALFSFLVSRKPWIR